MNVAITISLQGLRDVDLFQKFLEFNFFSENKTSLIIKIGSLQILQKLEPLILGHPQSPLFDRIKGLNLPHLQKHEKIDTVIDFLTNISQNTSFCSNLTTFGYMNPDCNLDLSNCSFTNLTKLSFRRIESNTILTLPKELPNLKTISFEDILSESKLDLSDCLVPNLTKITFGNLDNNATFILPKKLPNFETLAFGCLCNNAQLILPDNLDNLKELFFGPTFEVLPNLPQQLPNLETLSFGSIYSHLNLADYFLPKLKKLSFGLIIDNVHLSLPQSLVHLTKLSFYYICQNVIVILPKTLPNLTNLELYKDLRNEEQSLSLRLLSQAVNSKLDIIVNPIVL